MTSTLVRCRDGAFYIDPVIDIVVGQIHFPPGDPPVLMLWPTNEEPRARVLLPGEPPRSPWDYPDAKETLRRVLGRETFDVSDFSREGLCHWTTGDGAQHPPRQAQLREVKFRRRIPRPLFHSGTVRFARGRGIVMDWPAHHRDAHEIEVNRVQE